MDSFLPADLGRIAQELHLKRTQVEAFAALRSEGATVPFIARYRKVRTEALPEEVLRVLDRKLHSARRLTERRAGLAKFAEEAGRADDAFKAALAAATSHAELDDLAGMLHPRRNGYGDSARSVGLEPLADAIWREDPDNLVADPAETLARMIDPDKNLGTVEDVQRGIGMILAERLSRQAAARGACRPVVWAGKFVARPNPTATDPKLVGDFKQFASYGEPCKQTTPAKVVAVNRGERVGALVAGVEFDRDAFEKAARAAWTTSGHKFAPALAAATPEALALLATDLEQEVRREISEAAEEHLAKLLQRAVRNLLLQPGLSGNRILAIDPGIRLGVRWAVLETDGTLLDHGALHAVGGPAANRRKKKRKRADAIATPDQQTDWAARKLAEVDAAARGETLPPSEPAPRPASAAGEAPAPRPPSETPSHRSPANAPRPSPAPAPKPVPTLPADSFYCTTDPAGAGGDASSSAETVPDLVIEPTVAAEAHHPHVEAGEVEAGAPDEHAEAHGQDAGEEHADDHGEDGPGEPGGPPQPTRRERAKALFKELLATHNIRHLAIGSGPGAHDVEEVLGELVLEGVELSYAIVPEAAANAYANGPAARDEHPELDQGARRAVALGRRLRDPLNELLKVDPLQWGLGPLQGDIAPRLLRQRVEEAADLAVHEAGLDVNAASFGALRRIAGLDEHKAKALLAARAKAPFQNRLAVQEAAEMEDAAFAQAAGFLRVHGGDQPLDATWVHPENYPLAEQLLAEAGGTPKQLSDPAAGLAERLDALDAEALAAKYQTDVPTVWDSLEYLARPALDGRGERLGPPMFSAPVTLQSLQPGQHLRGTVLNVVDFGVFVGIGLREGGLVHLSEMANRFVPSPHEVASVGDVVDVWVLKVDAERKRVSLSMIPPDLRRGPGERRGGPGRGRPQDGQRGYDDRGQQGGDRFNNQGGRQGPGDRFQQGGPGERRPGRFDDSRQGPPRGGPRRPGGPGGPGGGRMPQERQPREYSAPAKPKPTPKLTTEKLEGRSVLHGFGELKAFFEAKKEPGAPPPPKPPAPPSDAPPANHDSPPAE